ncbi:thrombospondin-type laminin G domain and EAR repeat-containing protein-like [Boleophthalmus pectinirostris]|uniref:thrombospondin-type laminin G domain and EAR repeat-containing protein-like n=1 Tax=Boleophthalmus pectinirostris TaxID=150288 RepID=UPI0024314E64|nr:thrombospondin-type laminin G domain and EAR repeat-containing protein-like [Boleophthalmus pectinirostris]
MSFPSSELLPDCHLFPHEFSIVVTLSISHKDPQRNDYIFSLMDTNSSDRARIKKQKSNIFKTSQTTTKDTQERQVPSLDRGPLLLGLRYSRRRLHFLYREPHGQVKRLVFRTAGLADNHWHTFVLNVKSSSVTLTVDCNLPVEIVPSEPFPSELNIHESRFYVGSRGRWKGLFSGLLRQLVLVPGRDGAAHMCPSPEPQLTALSVPPTLLDLPNTGREGEETGTRHESGISVGLDRPCSEHTQGQLWFNPLKKALYLCDGSHWVTMLQDHHRLDYILEHQILTTTSETNDIEVFQVAGMGVMAALAHRSSAPGSTVYLWTREGFQIYQNISTHGALAWRHFKIGKKSYLVVSNFGAGGGDRSDLEPEIDFSVIYKWSRKRRRFVRLQTLQTHCARDWEAFTINQQHYLAVANHRIGNNHTIDSLIYKWNRLAKAFELHQRLPTSGAYDWEFFSVGPYHFLVVANAFDGVTTSVDSVIYVWVNEAFQVFQTIKTYCATDWEMFQIGGRVFLVVANGHRLVGSGQGRYAINSTIYELDLHARMFVRFQDITTYSAVDWEFFSLGEQYFLVVANSFSGETYSLNSVLYRWQGYEGFVPVHFLPTIGCSDWEFFTWKGESYLMYSSAKAPLSKVFKLKTY